MATPLGFIPVPWASTTTTLHPILRVPLPELMHWHPQAHHSSQVPASSACLFPIPPGRKNLPAAPQPPQPGAGPMMGWLGLAGVDYL